MKASSTASIPQRAIGPILFKGDTLSGEVKVPMATFESPLWPSTSRGAKISRLCGGIDTTVTRDCMARSIVLEANSAHEANAILTQLKKDFHELQKIVSQTSRFAKLLEMNAELVGKLLYVRFNLHTGDASGQNMVTKASDALVSFILTKHTRLKYISLSANYCTDKKVSAINGILGRGKEVIAELTIPRNICEKHLRTTPEKIAELNLKKNFIGSTLAGSLRSANAHFANMLLAVYLATGQDAANIVEGSQGITHAEVAGDALYFSVTLPNLIVGTVGNGKHLPFVEENLSLMDCVGNDKSQRLAAIIAGTVLCGELSLLAALTNQAELMKAHIAIERRQSC